MKHDDWVKELAAQLEDAPEDTPLEINLEVEGRNKELTITDVSFRGSKTVMTVELA